MKQLTVLLLAFCFTNAVVAQAQQKKPDQVAKFTSETVNFGKIKLGNPVTASFTLTNVSGEDLMIENVTPGCGCTKSDFTKDFIKPGKTGTISATYNAATPGNFSKDIYVKFAGVDEQKVIRIIGVVEQ
ncbi:MAG TPA: DUF1573 domain-containing protein [Lacibacter sp.]|nr:DUF1573 domain-containing protein [Lacibacter sp.]HMO89144.1 DUF1573 domain-containing protein [Lacibacter sp.]HMP87515.1 DUF1573 domain-containing protein [Lacibacter sp.]